MILVRFRTKNGCPPNKIENRNESEFYSSPLLRFYKFNIFHIFKQILDKFNNSDSFLYIFLQYRKGKECQNRIKKIENMVEHKELKKAQAT